MQIVTNFTSTKKHSWLWYKTPQNIEILVLNYTSMYVNFQHMDFKFPHCFDI